MINAKLVGGSAAKHQRATGTDLIVPIDAVVEYYDLNRATSEPTDIDADTEQPASVEMRVERFKHVRTEQDPDMGTIEIYEFQEVLDIQSNAPPKI
ncbi:hypothetical protein [Vitreoscilla stercoraria]|uniref:Uncharacterized protein n=1 Tax=Vitreoscilla stercoraria TaxID=61 RepID=A0ABY4E7Q7_VITST|nr:hypothetical protein [Vitreoscilla stercoraria]UOO91484.1 hypothetical protein LVJ81_07345 [Vitreoscilla stercoraria]